jgi:capsular exopolysaccharide synthesis family protein
MPVTIVDDLRALRKRWLLIAVVTALGLLAAATFVQTSTQKYEATAQLFVAAQGTDNSSIGLQSSDEFSQERVKSYSEIIDSPTITAPAAAAVGDGLTAKQVSKEVTASAPPNTVLLLVHVTDTSAMRAQQLANSISQTFSTYVANLERTTGNKSAPVKVTVVTPAALPTSPVTPHSALDIVLGLIIGLALGMTIAFVLETMDTSVTDAALVHEELGLAQLGAIMFNPTAKSRPLAVKDDRRSGWAEQFRKTCTSLHYVDVDEPPASIVVTSSVPDEGKTVTALNVAIAMAESGQRVALVEADLRRPRVGEYLGIESAVGLTTVLAGDLPLGDAMQSWGTTGNLDVLPSGPVPPNPSELLGSNAMTDMLAELEDGYDVVLIDSPPVLPVTDAAVLSGIASGTVVVTRYGRTRFEQLAQTVEELRSVDAKLYGLVMTMTPPKSASTYADGYLPYAERPRPAPERQRGRRAAGARPRREASGSERRATPASGARI